MFYKTNTISTSMVWYECFFLIEQADTIHEPSLLRSACSTTRMGVDTAYGRRSDALKSRLLRDLRKNGTGAGYGSLWCWVITKPPFQRSFHSLDAGMAMRLVCANQTLGETDAFFAGLVPGSTTRRPRDRDAASGSVHARLGRCWSGLCFWLLDEWEGPRARSCSAPAARRRWQWLRLGCHDRPLQ